MSSATWFVFGFIVGVICAFVASAWVSADTTPAETIEDSELYDENK